MTPQDSINESVTQELNLLAVVDFRFISLHSSVCVVNAVNSPQGTVVKYFIPAQFSSF